MIITWPKATCNVLRSKQDLLGIILDLYNQELPKCTYLLFLFLTLAKAILISFCFHFPSQYIALDLSLW